MTYLSHVCLDLLADPQPSEKCLKLKAIEGALGGFNSACGSDRIIPAKSVSITGRSDWGRCLGYGSCGPPHYLDPKQLRAAAGPSVAILL